MYKKHSVGRELHKYICNQNHIKCKVLFLRFKGVVEACKDWGKLFFFWKKMLWRIPFSKKLRSLGLESNISTSMLNSQLFWGFYRKGECSWVEGIRRSKETRKIQENHKYLDTWPACFPIQLQKWNPIYLLPLPPTASAPPAPEEEPASLQASGDQTQTDFHKLLPKGLNLEG